MNKEKMIRRIRGLSELPGVSGQEDRVRNKIVSMIDGYCQWKVDPLGNLLAFKEGAQRSRNTLMLSAHMDEIGFIITHVEDNGLLRFSTVGGIDSRVIIGKAVEAGDRQLYGVVGSKAVHMQTEEEKEKAPKPDELYIDIGADSGEEALRHVRPGDQAVYYAPFALMGDDRILGKAFDDRAGCAILIDLIQSDLPVDCHFAFTVQEETGCIGANTAAYSIRPDVSIVVEATTASDIPDVKPDRMVCRQGMGPVVSFMDKGAVYDRELYELAIKTAEENHIPVQSKEGVYGGNESRSIQAARGGTRVLAVSLPCRYIHSPGNVLKLDDIVNTAELMRRLIPVFAGLGLNR